MAGRGLRGEEGVNSKAGIGMREARRVRREAGGRREDEGGRREQGGGRRKEAGASGAANAGCTDARGADAPACAREHPCRRGVGGISWRFVSRRLSVRPGWHLRMLGMPGYGDGVILVVMSSVGLLVLACAGHHMRSADGDNSRSNRGGSQQVPPLRAELRSTSSLCFSSTYACIKEMELGVWFAAPTPLELIRGPLGPRSIKEPPDFTCRQGCRGPNRC